MVSTLFIAVIVFLTLFSLQPILSQGPAATSCVSRLITLAPCGPFVQGLVELPAQPCCVGLGQIYVQEPNCLCLFLNNTSTLSPAFPINQTLALQLPQLCHIPSSSSACSGVSAVPDSPTASPPGSSAGSSISLGAKSNSTTVAGKPAVQDAPRPASNSIMGIGYGLKSSALKLDIQQIVVTITTLLPAIFFI